MGQPKGKPLKLLGFLFGVRERGGGWTKTSEPILLLADRPWNLSWAAGPGLELPHDQPSGASSSAAKDAYLGERGEGDP